MRTDVHFVLMNPQELIDWYFRRFLPNLLMATADIEADAERCGQLITIAVDLWGRPEITFNTPAQPILTLVANVGELGPHPDQDLLDQLESFNCGFDNILSGAASKSYREIAVGATMRRTAQEMQDLFAEARRLHVVPLYQLASAQVSRQQAVSDDHTAVRRDAADQACRTMSQALSA